MKKVLFITTRLIYPVDGGRKVVMYNYCKGLYEKFNCEVYLFSFLEKDSDVHIKQPEFIKEVFYAKQPSITEKLKNTVINSIILRRWPFQVSAYYSKDTQKELYSVIDKVKPDIIIADMARTAEYIRDNKETKAFRILDMDDIISKRYKRQLESGVNNTDALGAYSKKLPSFALELINKLNLMGYILKNEYRLLSKYEKNLAPDFDSILFVSPVESAEYNKENNIKTADYVTIGVDYKYYSEKVSERRDYKVITYLGNMQVAHNKNSVDYFINNIFPIVRKRIPDAVFRIVGLCSEDFKKKYEAYEGIQITGAVDDIRKYIQDSGVLVAYLTYGSGIKTKILESMAMGVPVVTNSIGAEGLIIKNRENIIIEDDINRFADSVVELINNEELNNKIAANGQKNIYENYTWDNTIKRFNPIFERLEKERG